MARYKDFISEQVEKEKAVSFLKDASIEFEETVHILDLLNDSFDKVSDVLANAVESANSYNGIIEEGSLNDPISLDVIIEAAGKIENAIAALSEEIVSNIGKIDKEIDELRNS